MSEVGGQFSVGGESARPEWLTGIMVATVVQFEATDEGIAVRALGLDDGEGLAIITP